MFAKYRATRELQAMLEKYRDELDRCEDGRETNDLIDVIENLEWVVKEFKADTEIGTKSTDKKDETKRSS